MLFFCTGKGAMCVRASQASKKVRDLVLPAPKTPATARVDLPDRRASTQGLGKVGCLRTIRKRTARGQQLEESMQVVSCPAPNGPKKNLI